MSCISWHKNTSSSQICRRIHWLDWNQFLNRIIRDKNMNISSETSSSSVSGSHSNNVIRPSVESLLSDLGRPTRRGIRKCPRCGMVNGTRGLSCKNRACDMVFKDVVMSNPLYQNLPQNSKGQFLSRIKIWLNLLHITIWNILFYFDKFDNFLKT